MFRIILRLALIPFLCLSAVLVFVCTQPYDRHNLQDFLLLDACARPCFMGIQPGVTTPQQALNKLRSTDLIERVGVSESLETVAWFWNKDRSTLIDDQQISALFYDRDQVSSIRLSTRIQLGDFLLVLDPDGLRRVAFRQTGPYDSLHFDLYYVGDGYTLNALVDCHSFWTQPTYLILGPTPSFIVNQSRQTTSLNSAKHQIALICRRRNEG